MCRRFDLWGSEHDNYYLPSKKLTTALRTSKHLFPFYYIIRPSLLDYCIQHQLTQLIPSQTAMSSMFAERLYILSIPVHVVMRLNK